MGFLDKVRNGLKKTKESLIKNIETVVIGYAKIDDDFLEDLEMVLLSGDLGVRTTDYLMRQIRRGVTEGMISSTNEVMPFYGKNGGEYADGRWKGRYFPSSGSIPCSGSQWGG